MNARVNAALLVAVLLAGCDGPRAGPAPSAAPSPPPALALAQGIEAAHGREAWRGHEALRARIVVSFGGKTILSGRMLMRTDLSGTRLELDSGGVAVWDGRAAWISPGPSALASARFHVLTWPYFLAVPMKLRDPGSSLSWVGERSILGRVHDTARLSFAPGVGDAPEDWYLVYQDRDTRRLAALAYIVTYDSPREQAEKEPHGISYDDFALVDGVTLARRWTFWDWSEAEGFKGELTGHGRLDEIGFTRPAPDAFTRPAGAVEDPLPSPVAP
jgi:hypothetical protein